MSLSAPAGPDTDLDMADPLGDLTTRAWRPWTTASRSSRCSPTLPERERKILTMRFFGDMTQSQIAAELGISQMHVSRLLSQTLGNLRAALVDAA